MSGFGHPGGYSNPIYGDNNRYNQEEAAPGDIPGGNQEHPANATDHRFWQPATNCGNCRNYYIFDDELGLIKCPDPRCENENVIDPNAVAALPPQLPPQVQVPAPIFTNPAQAAANDPNARAPQDRRNRVRGRIGRPVGSRNSNQRGQFAIEYNPVPQPIHPQQDPNNPTHQVPAYSPIGRFFRDAQGQLVMWTGSFSDIMTPEERNRGRGAYPYDPRHDWSETSYANAAPRGCIGNEPEPEDMFRKRQKKWDDFVRACYFWDKMFILEQMGADRRSFPHIEGIHGPRLRGKLAAKKEFEEEMEEPGAWQGPWPLGVHECAEARAIEKPNMLKTRCNKCKELGVVGCSWSMKTCQNCLDNGWLCVRSMDYRPIQYPKNPNQGESPADRKKRLALQRRAVKEAADRAQAADAQRGDGDDDDGNAGGGRGGIDRGAGSRASPYPTRSRGKGKTSAAGPGPVRNIPGRRTLDNTGLLAYAPAGESATQEEQDEDAIFLQRSRLQLHPVIQHLRIAYQLWTNLAEEMATTLYDYEERERFVIPRGVQEVGGSQAWLEQFPQEVRDALTLLEQELRQANAGYEGGQHLVNRFGFNTMRQRRNLIRRQKYVAEQFLTIPLPLQDRWKCYRCYHFGLNCNVDENGCRSCQLANHFCQRSHQFTMEMRRDIVEASRQANAVAQLQADIPAVLNQEPGFSANQGLGPGGFPAAVPVANPNDLSGSYGLEFTPCQSCTRNGYAHMCGPETPCIMCVGHEGASTCRPGQRQQGMQAVIGGMGQVVQHPPHVPQESWPQSVGDNWNEFYGSNVRLPVREQHQHTEGLGFENDIMPFALAGPPNPAAVGGERPGLDSGPRVGDVYDPEGLFRDEDTNMSIDGVRLGPDSMWAAIDRDLGLNQNTTADQPQPRFPLADEPWDGATFATDATWNPFTRMMQRRACLEEIDPNEPDPEPEDGCDEPPFPGDPGFIKCGNQDARKCKYIGGSLELGDHPNPREYLVCRPHTDATREEYRVKGRETWNEAKGWVCQPCYELFGNERAAEGKVRERNDSRLLCSCRIKFGVATLCFNHTKKSHETVEARVMRYRSASMAKYGYKACGRCFEREGNRALGVWHCISCHEVCWEMRADFLMGMGY